jgi:hypothetical protein
MVEANPKSYKERQREARAKARGKRIAEKAARQRKIELIVEVKRLGRGAIRLAEASLS